MDQLHTHDNTNWAVYHVNDSEIADPQAQDWILQQYAHVHACWGHVQTDKALLWCATLPKVSVIHADSKYLKMLSWSKIVQTSLHEASMSVLQSQGILS
jgi:hypothetical protein